MKYVAIEHTNIAYCHFVRAQKLDLICKSTHRNRFWEAQFQTHMVQIGKAKSYEL